LTDLESACNLEGDTDSINVKTAHGGLQEVAVFRQVRRTTAGVEFCDSCARVSTVAQRAQRRLDRTRDQMYLVSGVR
jgi:hypothetical protein